LGQLYITALTYLLACSNMTGEERTDIQSSCWSVEHVILWSEPLITLLSEFNSFSAATVVLVEEGAWKQHKSNRQPFRVRFYASFMLFYRDYLTPYYVIIINKTASKTYKWDLTSAFPPYIRLWPRPSHRSSRLLPTVVAWLDDLYTRSFAVSLQTHRLIPVHVHCSTVYCCIRLYTFFL